jgi:hypothetical protein
VIEFETARALEPAHEGGDEWLILGVPLMRSLARSLALSAPATKFAMRKAGRQNASPVWQSHCARSVVFLSQSRPASADIPGHVTFPGANTKGTNQAQAKVAAWPRRLRLDRRDFGSGAQFGHGVSHDGSDRRRRPGRQSRVAIG